MHPVDLATCPKEELSARRQSSKTISANRKEAKKNNKSSSNGKSAASVPFNPFAVTRLDVGIMKNLARDRGASLLPSTSSGKKWTTTHGTWRSTDPALHHDILLYQSAICMQDLELAFPKVRTSSNSFESAAYPVLPKLPPNSVVFYLPDGCYVYPKLFLFLQRTRVVNTRNNFSTDPKYLDSKNSITLNQILEGSNRIYHKLKDIDATRRAIALLMDEIEVRLKRKDAKQKKQRQAKQKTSRIKEMQDELKSEMALLTEEKIAVQKKREDLLTKGHALKEQHEKLSALQSIVFNSKKDLNQLASSHLPEIQRQLRGRRRIIMYDLSCLYPITGPDPARRQFYIRDLALPDSSFVSSNDEVISTALGYVTHLMLLASKYLAVPLPFRLIYGSSRSKISDDSAIEGVMTYPLFLKGVDETRFDLAMVLLRKNTEFLLALRVPNYVKGHLGTLQNLMAFVQFEINMRLPAGGKTRF
jgi:hypothetical protein